eukprot:TRINITY_DN12482_c0_g1_i1.p1 TRINITY_DN12482_c0_g1~~TRINITY_DN12482_c0_g1_i1.p1  ORF type:complete len:587 (-),score=105.90 TRINITY_DN12482_c0_g1_i1:53-1642(-)
MESITMELDMLQNLFHPNIVRFIDYEDTDHHLYFIMEYVEGGSLHEAMRKFGVFPEGLLMRYMTQVLKGLQYLHEKGVIHRDIKGANILLTKEGLCKLADFGSCAYVVNKNNDMIGTPFWMAPEIIAGSTASIKSDIWSVGCCIIELVAGNPPYWNSGTSVALYRMVEDAHPPYPSLISPDLEDLLNQIFVKDVEKRPMATDLLAHILRLAEAIEPEPSKSKTNGGGSGGQTTAKKATTMRISSLWNRNQVPQLTSSTFSGPNTQPHPHGTSTGTNQGHGQVLTARSSNTKQLSRSIDESDSDSVAASSPSWLGPISISIEDGSDWKDGTGSGAEDDKYDKKRASARKSISSVSSAKRLGFSNKGAASSPAPLVTPSTSDPPSALMGPSSASLTASSSLVGSGGLSSPALPQTFQDETTAVRDRKIAYEAAVTAGYCETIKTLESLLHSTRSDKKQLSSAMCQSRADQNTVKSKALAIKELIGQQLGSKRIAMQEDLECIITLLNLGQSRTDNLINDLNIVVEPPQEEE